MNTIKASLISLSSTEKKLSVLYAMTGADAKMLNNPKMFGNNYHITFFKKPEYLNAIFV